MPASFETIVLGVTYTIVGLPHFGILALRRRSAAAHARAATIVTSLIATVVTSGVVLVRISAGAPAMQLFSLLGSASIVVALWWCLCFCVLRTARNIPPTVAVLAPVAFVPSVFLLPMLCTFPPYKWKWGTFTEQASEEVLAAASISYPLMLVLAGVVVIYTWASKDRAADRTSVSTGAASRRPLASLDNPYSPPGET